VLVWVALSPLGMTVFVTVVEGYPVVPAVGLSLGWVVAGWFVVRLMSGKLMTRTDHDEQMGVVHDTYQRQVDEVTHDRGEWRTESRIKDSTITELLDQQRGLLTSTAATVAAVMDAIKDNSRETHGGASS
jgi:thiamine biosynthesis lipoprotein ApbE